MNLKSTVLVKLDETISLLKIWGKDSANNRLHQITQVMQVAKGRIEALEAQLAETETMRDRIAIQILPRMMMDYGIENKEKCVARAYQWADALMAGKQP